MEESIQFGKPIYSELGSVKNVNKEYLDELFGVFFDEYYRYVKHQDVMKFGEKNYYAQIFNQEVALFEKTILTLTYQDLNNENTLFGRNQSFSASNSTTYTELLKSPDPALKELAYKQLLQDFRDFIEGTPRSDWGIAELGQSAPALPPSKASDAELSEEWQQLIVERGRQFFVRTNNVLVWVFRILQETLVKLEDAVINKSEAVTIPNQAIEKANEVLAATDQEGEYGKYVLRPLPEAEGTENEETYKLIHHNTVAQANRDEMRSFKNLSQKRLGAKAQEGAVVNTSMQDQSNILKSVAELNGKLIKSVISKK